MKSIFNVTSNFVFFAPLLVFMYVLFLLDRLFKLATLLYLLFILDRLNCNFPCFECFSFMLPYPYDDTIDLCVLFPVLASLVESGSHVSQIGLLITQCHLYTICWGHLWYIFVMMVHFPWQYMCVHIYFLHVFCPFFSNFSYFFVFFYVLFSISILFIDFKDLCSSVTYRPV